MATALKAEIEARFLGLVDVFVSSDPASLPLGAEWLARIRDHLDRSVLMIVLASPESVKRPWVNFEAGAVWLKGRPPVIPLCHSGMTRELLPYPLAQLQTGMATNPADLSATFQRIAEALGSAVPPGDDHAFSRTISEIERTHAYSTHEAQVDELTITPELARLLGMAADELSRRTQPAVDRSVDLAAATVTSVGTISPGSMSRSLTAVTITVLSPLPPRTTSIRVQVMTPGVTFQGTPVLTSSAGATVQLEATNRAYTVRISGPTSGPVALTVSGIALAADLSARALSLIEATFSVDGGPPRPLGSLGHIGLPRPPRK